MLEARALNYVVTKTFEQRYSITIPKVMLKKLWRKFLRLFHAKSGNFIEMVFHLV